ncbi:MAG: hypothetical protein E6Z07_09605 [Finegoldia magna]|nr:hypothetical protein [Finegoldia magna]
MKILVDENMPYAQQLFCQLGEVKAVPGRPLPIEELDDKADGMNIITKPTEQKLDTVMSNSFGFGGTNASLVMSKYKK